MKLAAGKIAKNIYADVTYEFQQVLYEADRSVRIDQMLFVNSSNDVGCKLTLSVLYPEAEILIRPNESDIAMGDLKEITSKIYLKKYDKILAKVDVDSAVHFIINGSVKIVEETEEKILTPFDADIPVDVPEEPAGGYGDNYGDGYGD
jgi:hypothetical protein